MYYLNSAIAQRVSVDVVACFTEGVKNGIGKVWRGTNGVAGVNFATIWDAVRLSPSTTAENVYTFASSDYEMEETSGDEEPLFEDKIYEQVLVNGRAKKRVIKADLTDFSDDKLGKIKAKFHAAGTAEIVKPYRYLVNMIRTGRDKGGKGNLILSGVDGQPFWGDHPIIPGKAISSTNRWTNDIVSAGGLTMGSGGTFEQMVAALEGVPGEDGQPCGSMPTHLAVGQLDRWTGIDLAYMQNPTSLKGAGNRYAGQIDLIYVPEWKAGECVLFDASDSLERGFIFQEREKNRLIPLYTNPDGAHEQQEDALSWMVKGRWEAGIGHPRRAVRLRRS